MIVYIKLLDKTKYKLEVDEKMSVLKLKNMINDILHIEILQQRLLYNGIPLINDDCLYKYKITDNSIIYLLYQLY